MEANAWDVALQAVTPDQLTSIQATVDILRGKVEDLEGDVDGIVGNVNRLFLLLNCTAFCFVSVTTRMLAIVQRILSQAKGYSSYVLEIGCTGHFAG